MTGVNAFCDQVDVSRETVDRLSVYAELVEKWNRTINLVSSKTVPHLWDRHFLDSAQIFDMAPETAKTWLDFGSGGGFPGVVVAIMAHERRPDLKVTCIESDLRKATFLKTVARETGIQLGVFSRRIEDVPKQSADVISARALTSLTNLLTFAERHMAESGTCLFLKGISAGAEIEDAKEVWAFECTQVPSKTEIGATILSIGEISRV